jgi:GTP-binding protein LepA
MLVDSWYDTYLGVIVLVRVIDGKLKKGMRVKLMSTDANYLVDRVGVFRPSRRWWASLAPARSASSPPRSRKWPIPASAIRSRKKSARAKGLPGFKPAQPVVFCGLFPVDAATLKTCATPWPSCG